MQTSKTLALTSVSTPKPPRQFDFLALLRPNRAISPALWAFAALLEAGIFALFWILAPFKVLPQPVEVLKALADLWLYRGLGQQLAVSLGLNLQALILASIFSLGLAYLTVIPLFRPFVAALSKGRFLSLTGFSLIFTLSFGGGHALKLALLSFAISVFYLTSMAAVIAAIPRAEFDHARTLGMSEARIVWEVVILGTLDRAFEVLRQNAAMGWMMLAFIELIARSDGGIGVMLENERKFAAYATVYAIQLVVLIVGASQDFAIEGLRRWVCPHANLTLERK